MLIATKRKLAALLMIPQINGKNVAGQRVLTDNIIDHVEAFSNRQVLEAQTHNAIKTARIERFVTFVISPDEMCFVTTSFATQTKLVSVELAVYATCAERNRGVSVLHDIFS